MSKNNLICYLNGSIVSEKLASINIYDLGFLRGHAVFDFLRTYNRKPFLLNEHINRFQNSAKLMNIEYPISHEETAKIISKIVEVNNITESTIRCVLTGGISENGMWQTHKPTFLIVTKELKPVPAETYKGVKLITDRYCRHNPEAKTVDYSNLVKKQKRIEKEKAFSLLYLNNSCVLEVAISNFFIIKNGIVITPKENILKGITRNLLINLISSGYKVEEREILTEELECIDEAFITGTTQGVVPVINIDGRIVGNGNVGIKTKEIMNIFSKFVESFVKLETK